MADLRREVKEAAAQLGWPEDLRFVGPHSLRHGGSQTNVKKDSSYEATHMGKASVRRYTEPNDSRRGVPEAVKEFKGSRKRGRE